MISNKNFTPIIAEILEDLAIQGIDELCPSLQKLFNELMKIEREQVLQAKPFERTELRKGYANGFKSKNLQTRFGKLELNVPQTRDISFYPNCLEKGERSERALRLAIAEMYVTGVSTRRVKRITEELCGMEVSSTQVSRMCSILDEELEKFRQRSLGKVVYLFLDARYEKVRHEGQVRDIAVLTAIGVNEQGYREILGISCSLSEAEVHWRNFLEDLLKRGLKGVHLVVSDAHSGLTGALKSVMPALPWQRCLFHLAQNAQHYAPSNAMKAEIAGAVKDIYLSLNASEAMERMHETVAKYSKKASKFCEWLEENFEQGLTFYNYPREHWKKIRTVNVSERLNQEIKRRTRVARLFPSVESCLRLIASVALEQHEEWVSGKKYMVLD
jgi:transposase-like protein